ncbi:MAG: hypothetical protein KDD39_11520 [Bdellovibrionales bacterium]|nr:hypothetical protein [Bdellovibrionales bacterium]
MRVLLLCCVVSLCLPACIFNTEKDRKVQNQVQTTYGTILVREIQGDDKAAYVYAEFAKDTGSRGSHQVITREVIKSLREPNTATPEAAANPCKVETLSDSGRDIFDPAKRVSVGELLYGPAANQQLLLPVPAQDLIYLEYLPSGFDAELKQIKAKGSDKVGAFSAAFSVPTPLEGVAVNGQDVATEAVVVDRKDPLIVEWDAPFLVNEDSIMALFVTAKDSFGTRVLKCMEFEKLIAYGTSSVKEWRIDAEMLAKLPPDSKAKLKLLRGHLASLSSSDKSLALDIEATRNWEKVFELKL